MLAKFQFNAADCSRGLYQSDSRDFWNSHFLLNHFFNCNTTRGLGDYIVKRHAELK